MTLEEITNDFLNFSEKKYSAKQTYEWLAKGVDKFEDMTNLSKSLRQKLEDNYFIPEFKIADKKISVDGTVKYLFKLYDNTYIESVVMKYKYGYTICVSTQVGCKMNCAFCSTGKSGFTRNLFASEMISQIHTAQKDMNVKISNVVLMGMGEPFDNYENVIKFIKLITRSDHICIGMRHICISTCGIVDKIYKLVNENLQVTLSVSLHASNDNVRNGIMKINNRWNISEIIEACKYYISKTNKRVCFEYVMIDGLNDNNYHAQELSNLLKGVLCYVNLIPLNDLNNDKFKKSSNNKIYNFKNILQANNIHATIRRTLGQDISGACGQLRYDKIN